MVLSSTHLNRFIEIGGGGARPQYKNGYDMRMFFEEPVREKRGDKVSGGTAVSSGWVAVCKTGEYILKSP